jgi:S-adenosyl-L-methionine hydrolase (adenosine-forming)
MSQPKIRHISLLTDFGLQDIYVGVMKGVIENLCPQARITDLCHGLPPQNLPIAALMLAAAVPYFSKHTLHLVVVDPGVGSNRQILYAKTRHGHFLAPDNGVLSTVLKDIEVEELRQVNNRKLMLPKRSQTFHGRDIFAPVAAHLCSGVSATELGPLTELTVQLELPEPKIVGDEIHGEFLFFDVFGNAVTNIPADQSHGLLTFSIEEIGFSVQGPVAKSYSDREIGQPLLIGNSFGLLELALNQGDAAKTIGLRIGQELHVALDSRHYKSKS